MNILGYIFLITLALLVVAGISVLRRGFPWG
jgi:hypothetical protein